MEVVIPARTLVMSRLVLAVSGRQAPGTVTSLGRAPNPRYRVSSHRYDLGVRYLPNALAVLSLPAGAIGYIVAAQVLSAVLPAGGADILVLFVPLLVAGLVMLPFLI